MDQFSSKNFQLRCLAIHAHTVETGWCSYKVIIAQVKIEGIFSKDRFQVKKPEKKRLPCVYSTKVWDLLGTMI